MPEWLAYEALRAVDDKHFEQHTLLTSHSRGSGCHELDKRFAVHSAASDLLQHYHCELLCAVTATSVGLACGKRSRPYEACHVTFDSWWAKAAALVPPHLFRVFVWTHS